MSTLLLFFELPRDADGIIVGEYSVRAADGAPFEGWEGPRSAADVLYLNAAHSDQLRYVPTDAETAEACARHIFECSGDGKRAKALRALFARKAPRAKR